MTSSSRYDLSAIKLEAHRAILKFSQRGLFCAAEWLSQLCYALKDVRLTDPPLEWKQPAVKELEYDKYSLAFSYFSDQQYERCAFYLKKTKSRACRFLQYYSTFLNLEMKKMSRLDYSHIFETESEDSDYVVGMTKLYHKIKQEYLISNFDGFQLYVYGLVLKRLALENEAKSVLIEAVHVLPINWSAWIELCTVISDREDVQSIKLPNHWMRDFFFAHLFHELHLDEDAITIFKMLICNGFDNFVHIYAYLGCSMYHLNGDMQAAYDVFKIARRLQPTNFVGMDIFAKLLTRRDIDGINLNGFDSNVSELAQLAVEATENNILQYETQLIIGNYYSYRNESAEAIVHFKYAIKINPYVSTAWTFLGEEMMIVKNPSAAILAFRRSVFHRRNDYVALFGLAQAHEINRIPLFALHYIKKVCVICPEQPEYIMWMGEMYEKLDNISSAIKCYDVVKGMNQSDPLCIIRLARLHELTDVSVAVKLHEEIADTEILSYSIKYRNDYINSCSYLSRYYALRKEEDKATRYSELIATAEALSL